MIGFEYICKLQGIQYKQIAEMLDISKQTVNSWTSGARKIPKKYLPTLSQRFKIPEIYLQKELSKIEELEIQKMRLENELVGIEYENTYFDKSTGKEELIKSIYYDNGIVDSISHTKYESEVEGLVGDIKETINKSFNDDSNSLYQALNSSSKVVDLYQMFTDLVADEKVNKSMLEIVLLATKTTYQDYSSENEFVLKIANDIKELDTKLLEEKALMDIDDGLFE